VRGSCRHRRALLLRRGFVKRCRRVTGAHAARNRGGGIVGGMTRGALLLLGLTLVRSLGDPAAIALENMRLNAELREQLEELRSSRARLVEACDAERRRLERNLHDGAQQRLVAVAVHLGRLQRRVRGDAVAEEIAAAAAHELAESLQELRELAHGLHPAVAPARPRGRAGGARHTFAGHDDRLVGVRRPPPAAGRARAFVACEALTNVAKYASASRVDVRVRRDRGSVFVEISDDGVGGADERLGSGLRGLADRLEALDGSLHVVSPARGGTVVTAAVPCA
jgi:signal transduction histidine kinase